MAPHRVCVGEAMAAEPLFGGLAKHAAGTVLEAPLRRFDVVSRRASGLRKLLAHYDALLARRVTFRSGFLSAAMNAVVTPNWATRLIANSDQGRNTSRMGITKDAQRAFPRRRVSRLRR